MNPIVAKDIQALEKLIGGARKVVVASHTHPDGDALGSCTGMALYLQLCCGKEATCLLPDPPGDNLQFILPEEGLPCLCFTKEPEPCREAIGQADLIILVDANHLHRTEGLEPLLQGAAAPKVLIDHHVGPDTETFCPVFSETEISSASELLYWILKELHHTPLPLPVLRALTIGMTTDTNNFANSVFPSTFRMASEVVEAGVDRDAIVQQIFFRYRENRVRLFGYMQSEGLHLTDNGAAWMILDKAVQERFQIKEGESEGLVNVPLAIDSVRLSILLKEDQGHFRISIRSKKGTSARLLAQNFFHGGGHENAAGGKLFFPADIPAPGDAAEYVQKALKAHLS